MDEKKRSEVLAFFWFIVASLTLLSLISYTPDDIAFEVSIPNSPAQNFVGVAGAYTAWLLKLVFGNTAFFLVPLFLLWAFAKWAGKRSQHLWLKIFSSVTFFASACALFAMVGGASAVYRFQAGGMLGFFTSMFLSHLFGNAGIFVALSLFILSILLATELLVLDIAGGLFKRSKQWMAPALQKASDKMPARPAKTPLKPITEIKPGVLDRPKAPSKPLVKMPEETPPPPAPTKPQIRVSAPPKTEEPKSEVKPKPAVIRPAEGETPGSYELPSMDLLEYAQRVDTGKVKSDLEESSKVLEDTLRDFGIEAKVVEVEQGPTITRYELQPAAGVKVGKITSLENDIALAMRAASVRIIAPIPGKSRVGIEVPNSAPAVVSLKEVLASTEFQRETSRVAIGIGKDTSGAPLVCNLADMPHLLIAGSTNTGKSVCINSIIMSLLFRSTPDELKLILIDPKMVELHFYNELPHLISPVVTDKGKVPGVLAWLVAEMERRYRVLSKVGAKNLLGFNEKVERKEIRPETLVPQAADDTNDEPIIVRKMPYIVLVIDELADLMMASAQEVETAITRLAQLARAVGIHMILATQRPSVDVITGVIKANFPARLAFQVASKVDSRTILDENGADKLLGRGDMLMMDPRKSKLVRAQGAWVKDSEIEKVMSFIKSQRKPIFEETILQVQSGKKLAMGEFKKDEVYEEAKRVVLETGQASVSMVQRRLGVGYTRAARLIDMMEEEGVVGPYRGAKPREILVERPNAVEKAEG